MHKFKLLNSEWFIVVNPKAGGGKGKTDWPVIENLLNRYSISYSVAFTEFKYHAVELTVKAINNGFKKIIAAGGDGTLNEVINGIFIQKKISPIDVTVGVIAVGTGNDWYRMYNTAPSYEDCVKAIQSEQLIKQDIGKVEYTESLVHHARYFANAAGTGFDAEVAIQTNKLKEFGQRGKFLYLLSLLKVLVGYRHTQVTISIDGDAVQENMFSLTLGIGRYNGAGMMQVPNAVVNDGLYDITLIRKVSIMGVIGNTHRLFNGSILNHPKISSFRGRIVEVNSNPPVNLEADGESLGESPLRFTILPEAINIVTSKDSSTMISSKSR